MPAPTPRTPLPLRTALAGLLAVLFTAGSASASSYTITLDGTPLTVATTVVNEKATISFSGTAGHRVSIRLTQVQMGPATVTVRKPDNTVLKTAGPYSVTGGFIAPMTLPATGTYKIVLDPADNRKGSARVEAWDVPADLTTPIAKDGTLVTQTYTAPGQNGALTFSGNAGERITLLADGGASTAKNITVQMKAPSGAIAIDPVTTGFAGAFYGPVTLTETGTYTITSNPPTTTVGTAEFQVWSVPADQTGTVTVGGGNQLLTFGTPGQNGNFTFTGGIGQKVTLAISPVALTGNPSVAVRLRKPDNTVLANATVSNSGGLIEPVVLPVGGTYTVQVDPQKQAVGDVTLNLFNSPADLSGTLTSGTPLTATFGSAGQNASYTVAGQTGKYLSVKLSNVTVPSAKVTVLKPDGTTLIAATTFNTAGKFLDATTLPVNGNYKIVIDPQGISTGSMDVRADVFPPVASFPATVGTGVVVNTLPGQNAAVTFTPAAGVTKVSFTFTSTTMGSTAVSGVSATLKQGATIVKSGITFGNNGTFVDQTTVTPGSAYTLSIDPQGANSGTTTVTVYDVTTDATFASIPLNVATAISNTKPGQNIKVTFAGTINRPLPLWFDDSTLADVGFGASAVKLIGPAPATTVVKTWSIDGGDTWKEDLTALPATGTYTLTIDPYSSKVGSVNLTVNDPPADSATSTAVTVGGSAATATTTVMGQNTQFTFTTGASVPASYTVTYDLTNTHPVYISVIKVGSPNVVVKTPSWYLQGDSFTFTPAASSSYIIKVDPEYNYTGTWTISVG